MRAINDTLMPTIQKIWANLAKPIINALPNLKNISFNSLLTNNPIVIRKNIKRDKYISLFIDYFTLMLLGKSMFVYLTFC